MSLYAYSFQIGEIYVGINGMLQSRTAETGVSQMLIIGFLFVVLGMSTISYLKIPRQNRHFVDLVNNYYMTGQYRCRKRLDYINGHAFKETENTGSSASKQHHGHGDETRQFGSCVRRRSRIAQTKIT